MTVENSKGECNLGQHEINFRYGEALRDRRRARDLQERRQGDRRPGGHVDHLHGEVQRARGQLVPHPLLARATRTAATPSAPTRQLFERFVAGQLACMRELTLLFAPHVNSYKRFAPGSFAPTAVAWGHDNRTCSMRVVGHGAGAAGREPAAGRRRQPLPGARGDDRRRPARDRRRARARAAARGQRLRVRQAARADQHVRGARPVRRPARSRARRSAQEVVDHYLNRARVELDAFEAAVTDWERFRGFERL